MAGSLSWQAPRRCFIGNLKQAWPSEKGTALPLEKIKIQTPSFVWEDAHYYPTSSPPFPEYRRSALLLDDCRIEKRERTGHNVKVTDPSPVLTSTRQSLFVAEREQIRSRAKLKWGASMTAACVGPRDLHRVDGCGNSMWRLMRKNIGLELHSFVCLTRVVVHQQVELGQRRKYGYQRL